VGVFSVALLTVGLVNVLLVIVCVLVAVVTLLGGMRLDRVAIVVP
jgi:sorbitol-specific phosphotransferase system component IIC